MESGWRVKGFDGEWIVILMCESEENFNKFFRSQKKFISVTSQVLGPFLGLYLF